MLALEHDGFQSYWGGERGIGLPLLSLASPVLLYQARLGGEGGRCSRSGSRSKALQFPTLHIMQILLSLPQ